MSTVNGIAAVALDVDGTLARDDHQVSEYAIGVLRRLEAAGIRPIVVTGRLESSAVAVADAAGLSAPVVSGGGAIVTDPRTREHLVHAAMDPALIDRLIEVADRFDLQPVLHTAGHILTDRPSRHTDLIERLNQWTPEVLADRSWPADVVKVMLVGEQSDVDAMQAEAAAEFPRLKRSSTEFLEANAPGFTKWESLRFTLDRMGVSPSATMGAGDGETDVEWLSNIGQVVAPENSEPSVLAIAHHRVGHHRDDAVARFLDEHLLAG